jgi:hypothetical protein
VTTHVRHRGRRLHEVRRAETQLDALGVPSSMLTASQDVFVRTVHAQESAPPPDGASSDVEAALSWLSSAAGGTR